MIKKIPTVFIIFFAFVIFTNPTIIFADMRQLENGRYEPIVTTHKITIPNDINDLDQGSREIHILAKSIPLVKNGKIVSCLFRWRDLNGKNKPALGIKIEGLTLIQKIAVFFLFGENIPLTYEKQEEKESCTSEVRVMQIHIFNEKGQHVTTVDIPTYKVKEDANTALSKQIKRNSP